MQKNLVALLALAGAANATASLKDVKHVIMLMMENRSFQHVSYALLNLYEVECHVSDYC
jgi:phospholipase C